MAHQKCEEFTPGATRIQSFFKTAIIKLDEHLVFVTVRAAAKTPNSSIPYIRP